MSERKDQTSEVSVTGGTSPTKGSATNCTGIRARVRALLREVTTTDTDEWSSSEWLAGYRCAMKTVANKLTAALNEEEER